MEPFFLSSNLYNFILHLFLTFLDLIVCDPEHTNIPLNVKVLARAQTSLIESQRSEICSMTCPGSAQPSLWDFTAFLLPNSEIWAFFWAGFIDKYRN